MFSDATMALMDRALSAGYEAIVYTPPAPMVQEYEPPRARFAVVEIELQDLSRRNTFFMVAFVRREIESYLRIQEGYTPQEARLVGEEFFNEALSQNADHALRTVMDWVTVNG